MGRDTTETSGKKGFDPRALPANSKLTREEYDGILEKLSNKSGKDIDDLTKQEIEEATLRFQRVRISGVMQLSRWKKRTLFGWVLTVALIALVFLGGSCFFLHNEELQEQSEWYQQDSGEYDEVVAEAETLADADGATHVTVGTYMENFSSISIKESNFKLTYLVWFRWNDPQLTDMIKNYHIYNGSITSTDVLADTVLESGEHYQLARVNATVSKNFRTSCFPLASNQLHLYLECDKTVADIIFEPDYADSGYNPAAKIPGFIMRDYAWGISAYEYGTNKGDTNLSASQRRPVVSEYLTAITISRDGWGLYLKCFIAMYGTSLWVLIMLYVCGHHRVNSLSMIPAALFGTVSNIMVGAALVPDALNVGLLELTNIWGVITILACTLAVIRINNIRSEHGNGDEAFARFFGRTMFYEMLAIAVIGNIVLPVSAYLW